MWRVVVIVVTLSGCARLFGLEPPVFDDGRDDGGTRIDGHFDAHGDGAPGDGSTMFGCPQSYVTTLGTSQSQYRIVTNLAISWDSARDQCLADQLSGSTRYTHLVVAASDIELSALDAAVSNEIWTGLSDLAIEGTYQWVSKEMTSYPPTIGDPWGSNEPVSDSTKDCVYMNTTGDLAVQSCSIGKQFVCECDTFMNDPSHY